MGMLFVVSDDPDALPALPYPSEMTSSISDAVAVSFQAHLDDFPFGKLTPPNSNHRLPALVLSAGLDFVCTTAAFYALLS